MFRSINCWPFFRPIKYYIAINLWIIERMKKMLLIENKKGMKVYTIKNKYLCECGVLNEKNVCNACMKYKERKLKND